LSIRTRAPWSKTATAYSIDTVDAVAAVAGLGFVAVLLALAGVFE
jgi:hypothetical protein